MKKAYERLSQAAERLATGSRINSAADDAAGMAIAQKMTAQINGMEMEARNTQDAMSMMNTADGAMGSMQDAMQRMRELSVQASNGTLTDEDRALMQYEMDELTSFVKDTVRTSQYNGIGLFENTPLAALASDDWAPNILTQDAAASNISRMDSAIGAVSAQRASGGAKINAAEHRVNNLVNSATNLNEARSRIQDADLAVELMTISKMSAMYQANAMLSDQINQMQGRYLDLFM